MSGGYRTPPLQRQASRSRTPPRQRDRVLLERKLRGGPGRGLSDLLLGRLSSYRLLDVEACLREFCDGKLPTNIAVLGCGPGSEVDSVCQHFTTVGTALTIDSCDWSSHTKAPTIFRQLELRSDRDQVLKLLRDEVLFPGDVKLLVIVSCVAAGHYSELIKDYCEELPGHADLLLLEPLKGAAQKVEKEAVGPEKGVNWQGFVYAGGPRHTARFFSRLELPLAPLCG
mmetsp:Transcript_46368/g.83689  ORF Transcript_46368/g.83689 Transcript_46368/m.83689 type:complete len:227 (+) Transcript_46368:52-732(+)|eukprot:CAMPEP_0197626048 /NCGR_PEP_ID=MMETSP1338-20131121/5200_1 /TAXON_ID=43686 ORGANISM="Pelagodinium beii, Strain RCC1491" /NCGR_SAMPLE_ID=MMETSP1338 /ASSEMBLY_ACC=CAM_ASM_000754 /LENGTH=226 /DNA_ID=CAMNT_0043196565 /DNA_START=49 /DNA_END=729 /DNA_ORIENTATION=+